MKITEEICGNSVGLDMTNMNSEETLAAVIDVLRDYSENRKPVPEM